MWRVLSHHKQVRGLEVAVHNWRRGGVEVSHALGDVDAHLHPPAVVQLDLGVVQQPVEAAAREVLGHDRQVRRGRADAHEQHDVRVAHLAHHRHLGAELLQRLLAHALVAQHLDRHHGRLREGALR